MPKSVKTAVQQAAQVLALTLLGTAGLASQAQAESLMDLYQAAKGYDAAYLSAKAQADSVQYAVEQSYALMRPSLGLKASINRSHFEGTADIPPALQGTYGQSASSTNKTGTVAAKMPLLNRADAIKIDQAEQQLVAAQADLNIAENDLAARLAQAYFDVLAAQDGVTTTQANRKALAEQLASAKRNFEVGNATITDTREAQARHDLAAAQEIAATNELQIKRMALDQLVGRADVKPSPLVAPLKLDTLAPGQMDDWVAKSASAPSVRKAEVFLKGSQLEIERAKAGHWPTLDATANYTKSNIDSNNIQVRAGAGNTASVGLELNLPLYAGGAVQNRIKETLALTEKAERDVDNAKRTSALYTRQFYAGVQSSLAQVKAYEAAEASAKLALEATQLGYRVGVRINKDVLDAQTALTSAQRDLYKARYDVIVGSVKLKQVAGTLNAGDLGALNNLSTAAP